jgi:hypothetical protein
MSPSSSHSHIAALTLTAAQQALLLEAVTQALATDTDLERTAILRTLHRELGGLSAADPAVLLTSGGAGLRLLYEVLLSAGVGTALSDRIHTELAPADNALPADALVTVIFDPTRQ